MTGVPPYATLADQALVALAVHRLLTLEQLREMLNPQASALTNWSARLNTLAREGLARALPRPSWGPKLWCATSAGLRQALTEPDQWRRYTVPETGGTSITHTWALNEACLAFVRAARDRGEGCDWRSWEHEVAHAIGNGRGRRTLIVDAVMDYDHTPAAGESRSLRRFLELDRATEPVHRLIDKLRLYATYRAWTQGPAAGRPGWRARYTSWPPTCVVIGANPVKNRAAIDRRIDALVEGAATDPLLAGADPLPVLICHLDDLTAAGPWAPIWWRLDRPENPVDFTGRRPTADAEPATS